MTHWNLTEKERFDRAEELRQQTNGGPKPKPSPSPEDTQELFLESAGSVQTPPTTAELDAFIDGLALIDRWIEPSAIGKISRRFKISEPLAERYFQEWKGRNLVITCMKRNG